MKRQAGGDLSTKFARASGILHDQGDFALTCRNTRGFCGDSYLSPCVCNFAVFKSSISPSLSLSLSLSLSFFFLSSHLNILGNERKRNKADYTFKQLISYFSLLDNTMFYLHSHGSQYHHVTAPGYTVNWSTDFPWFWRIIQWVIKYVYELQIH